ncbi:alpha/beta fold hydrolase [Phytohalomonas tamaricis]|uniref:alpha/beta fold hydrolase n=1 Tax=Phytohalomonas tamaricis TaxID=2081032 RepID=UPI000D0BABC1|nr:alpha/beta hydrolase [Phytohalomonas tamaricis]
MDNKRSRKPRNFGRLAIFGTAAWMAYAAFQKKQALKARRSSSSMPVAPELSRSAMIDGILMRWEEHGKRDSSQPPVIMVHGIPTNPRIWRYVIPHLTSTGTQCLAWELVGFGWSIDEGLGRDISIPKQAEYLAAWLKAQGIERAVFVGHDVGGGVVQALLAARPELFAGLVLTDVVAFDNWPVAAMKTARQFNWAIDKLPPAMLKPIFHAGLSELGHDDARRGAESAALLWEPYARPTGAAGFANQARHMSAKDTLAAAAHLPNRDDLPVRIVWGEDDPLDIASAERLATLLSAPPVRRIPGARHFNPEDHPDIVADEIRSVLGEIHSGPLVERS